MIRIDAELQRMIPPLDQAEVDLLEASIVAEGCRDPLVVWKGEGILVDGHNRHAICTKHGLQYAIAERDFADRLDVIEWMCVNQLGRRNLAPLDRDDLIGQRFKNEKQREGRPDKRYQNDTVSAAERTREKIAKDVGVSAATVQRNAQFTDALDTLETIGVQRNEVKGKKRKVKKKQVVELANLAKKDPESAKKAWAKVAEQGESSGAIKTAIREVQNEAACEVLERTRDSLVEIHHGDFYELSRAIPDGSIDAIITDPPYPHEFLHTWSQMAEVGMRVLKPGGWCIAYSGKQHLEDVMRRMKDAGLAYFWQVIFVQTVTATIHPRKVNTRYKPILIFQKPPITPPEGYFVDMFDGEKVEKSHHEWQQSENGFVWLIEKFTNPGDRILEPFAGGGTCPKVAQSLNRFCVAYEIDKNSHAASCLRVFGNAADAA
jgi:16S rRNA G966 N2-methylase RsmD